MNYMTSPFIRLQKTVGNKFILIDYYRDKLTRIDPLSHHILKQCLTPASYSCLIKAYGTAAVETLMRNKLLLSLNEFETIFAIYRAEIETTTLCNWNCSYCPRSHLKRPKSVLSQEDFATILTRCKELRTIKTICLHAYNEPTLDPLFMERVNEIKRQGFSLELFTNGSNLSQDKVEHLVQSGIVKKVVCNMPTLNQERFRRLTGSNTFTQSLHNIDRACKAGLPVFISVLSKSGNDAPEMRKRFPSAIINPLQIQDRAGTVPDKEYRLNINLKDRHLYGCFYFSQILYVSVTGDCFPCINDSIRLKYRFGNILQQSLPEIYHGAFYHELRSKIFGLSEAGRNFMCRKCIFMQKNKLSYYKTWNPEEVRR